MNRSQIKKDKLFVWLEKFIPDFQERKQYWMSFHHTRGYFKRSDQSFTEHMRAGSVEFMKVVYDHNVTIIEACRQLLVTPGPDEDEEQIRAINVTLKAAAVYLLITNDKDGIRKFNRQVSD
jgi:hypothetical protein